MALLSSLSSNPSLQPTALVAPSYRRTRLFLVFLPLIGWLVWQVAIVPSSPRGTRVWRQRFPSDADRTFSVRNQTAVAISKDHESDFHNDKKTPIPTNAPSSLPTVQPYPNSSASSSKTPSPSSSCRRTCFNNSHDNILIWRELSHAAGLLDRLYVLDTLLQMAGYLCARVYAPRPRFLLIPTHNMGQPLDPNMAWHEFVWYQYIPDNNTGDDRDTSSPLVDWFNANDRNDAPHVFSVHHQYPNDPYYLSDEKAKINLHFEKVEHYVWNVQQPLLLRESQNNGNHHNNNNQSLPFIWEITTEFYGWVGSLHSMLEARKKKEEASSSSTLIRRNWTSLPTFCNYVEQSSPAHLAAMRDHIMSLIQQTSSSSSKASKNTVLLLGELSIRRGDATLECDTSLQRMKAYLNCSLWDAWSALLSSSTKQQHEQQRQHVWQVKILLSSDERNTTYRQNVGQLLQDLALQVNAAAALNTVVPPRSMINVTLVDMDQLARQMIRQGIEQRQIPPWRQNNFYVFQVISETKLALPLRFRLQQRRRFQCPNCTNAKQQLVDAGVL